LEAHLTGDLEAKHSAAKQGRSNNKLTQDVWGKPKKCVSLEGCHEASAFRNELRAAREACQKDAEAFDEILFVVERLGARLSGFIGNLGQYEHCLRKLAERSRLAADFSGVFKVVREARNEALHQGAVARHLAARAVELALILEDALATQLGTIEYLMVQEPVVAHHWQTLGAVRRIMLVNAFSYLPFNWDGQWFFLADYLIATFWQRRLVPDRGKALATPLGVVLRRDHASKDLLLLPADENQCGKHLPPYEAAGRMKEGRPLLVVDPDQVDADKKSRLIGLISPADLL